MIEPELTLLEMQVKGRAAHPLELDESRLSDAPEPLDAVDMAVAAHELVAVMTDSVMLPISHVDDAVVGAKAVRMNRRRELDPATNNGLQLGFCAVRDDLGEHAAVALVDAEDDGLATRAAPPLAAHAAGAEVTLVEFDLASKRRLALTVGGDRSPNQAQVAVDCIAVQGRQGGDLRGRQIECKELEQLPEFSPRNPCASKSLGTDCHDLV